MECGPGESRMVEEKRHYEKPIPISDLVFLDRERCILCDRCTRFAKEVAGDPLIHFTHRGNETQILTFPDQPFASYFSGNTVQICPVGALTAKPYRFKARPWDLDQTESTCTTCSVGCRITVQASRNELLRYQGVDSDPVNWGWLCDKGRFDFEAVNSERAVAQAVGPPGRRPRPDRVVAGPRGRRAPAMQQALAKGGPGTIAVLGGARGTNEDAYAWAKLAKGVIGTDHVDAQLGDGLDPSGRAGPAARDDRRGLRRHHRGPARPRPEGGAAGPVPAAAGRRREARHTPGGAGLPRHRPHALHLEEPAAPPGRAGGAGAVALDPAGRLPDGTGVSDADAADVRDQLAQGQRGRGRRTGLDLAESAAFTHDAVAVLHGQVEGATFLATLRRGNVNGAIDMGLSPGLLPGGVKLADAGDALRRAGRRVPTEPGLDAGGILQAAADGRIACLVLLGADPVVRLPRPRPGAAGPRRRRARSSPSTPSSTSPPGAPTWCWPPRPSPRSPAPPPTSKGASAPSASRSRRSARPTPTGSSRPTWPPDSATTSGSARSRRSGTRSGRSHRATPPCRRPSSGSTTTAS